MTLKQAIAPHIEQAIAGNQYHLGKMLEAARPYFVEFVHQYAGRQVNDAEDVVQMALIKLHGVFSRGAMVNGRGITTYFYKTIRHEYLNWYRLQFLVKKSAVRGKVEWLEDHKDFGESDPDITDLDRMDAVQEMVEGMNEKYREIFRLRYIEKKKYQHIAKEMDMPLNSVRTALFRIKEYCTERAKVEYRELAY